MSKTSASVGIGMVLLGIGVYLFPFGQDVFTSYFMKLSNGNFWMADMYMYVVTISLMLVGVILVKPDLTATLKNPKIGLIVIGVICVFIYMAMTLRSG